MDIAVGAGAPATITMVGTETTAALVAARINATYPGLASAVDGGARVQLVHASRVRVTASPDFDKLGIPIEDRNTADPATEDYIVPIRFSPDRIDEVFSSALDIPNDANRVGLWIGVEGRDTTTNNRWGIQVFPMWSNGVEGEPPFSTAFGTSDLIADPAVVFPSGDEAEGAVTLVHSDARLLVGSIGGFRVVRYMELAVPIGATKFRLLTTGAASAAATPYTAGNPPPLYAPILSCAALVGVRS